MIKTRIPTAILLVLLFWIVASSEPQSIDADTGKLMGKITTEDITIPFQDTFVYIHYYDGEERANLNGRIGDIKAKVDSFGYFEVRLSPYLYDVFVAASGHLPDCRVVRIESGKTTAIDVNLKRDLADMTANHVPVIADKPTLAK